MASETDHLTKQQLLNRLGSQTKERLVAALGSSLSKEQLVSVLASRLKKEELAKLADQQGEYGQESTPGEARSVSREVDGDTALDCTAELAWSPPPAPTPAPVAYTGPAPSM